MVSWALVLETAIKWLIPALCVAIVGLVASRFVKPWKTGTKANQQQQWDECMKNSELPKTYCDQTYNKLKAESDAKDSEILKSIKNLSDKIEENHKEACKYHERVDEQMDGLRLGVLDAHLQNLIQTCKQYIRRGYITLDEYDVYKERYETYKKLGGNGHMDHWNKLIEELPHKDPNGNIQQVPPAAKPVNPPKTHI